MARRLALGGDGGRDPNTEYLVAQRREGACKPQASWAPGTCRDAPDALGYTGASHSPFERYGGDPARLVGDALSIQRDELLKVYGIGPETADSILLYAAGKPVFVVDAYSRRICARLGLAREDASYEQLQQLFMDHLDAEVGYFNEYHALLVALGKRICTKRAPRCDQCPLNGLCPKVGVNPPPTLSAWEA